MIDHVQNHLEAIYGLECEARARSFVVDARVAQELGVSVRAEEELLVLEEEGELGVALYLSPRLLRRYLPLERRGPNASELLGAGLEGYLQVAEGVSHFVYLSEAARKERRVSLLELEAQAEVDKFAICVLHRWSDSVATWAQELVGRLFERVRFLPHLSSAERGRYVEANRLARRYCERLMKPIRARRMDRLLSELRYSYRLSAEAKFAHLSS